MVRSARVTKAGAVLLCASAFVLTVALPRLAPFEVVHCVPPGQTVCFSGVDPAYPAAFLLALAGAVVVFLGEFGRGFVVNPVFVAGMIALAYGMSGVVSAVLDAQRANPVDPRVFAPSWWSGRSLCGSRRTGAWATEGHEPGGRFYPARR